MFSNVDAGWADFQLPGTYPYSLSYLTPVPFEWLDAAIHGLETLQPFCVKGYLEPGRMICTVSYRNCYVVCEDDDRTVEDADKLNFKCSTMGMLEFCQQLAEDIQRDLDAWACFYASSKPDDKALLERKLVQLHQLIRKRESILAGQSSFYGWL